MRLNNTYKNYSMLGIFSFLILLMLAGCGVQNSDFQAVGEWAYKNNSSHSITVEGVFDFDLTAGGSHSFTLKEVVGKGDFEEGDYIVPYKVGDVKIIFDGNKEFIPLADQSILNKKLYEADKIGQSHYRFT